ncbi:MAG: hypothetical protein ACREFD_11605 [Stellaceae bacterium]
MTRDDREGPHVTPESDRLAAERLARLGAELRANLARRKAQARKRAADEARAAKSLEPGAN